METLPEPQDPIKRFLSWFMSDEDVARYSDLSYVLETIRKDELCWQAAVSIGVHAIVFGHFGETDEEKALVKNLAGYALEPMEALHESLTQQARQQPLANEQARMLFHLRFALGFLFQYGKGDAQRALGFLHEITTTQLSRRAGAVRSGGDTVTYTDDIRRGKELAAQLMSTLCTEMDEYEETLSLITEAAGVTGDPLGLLGQAGGLLDRWAARCEAIEQREDADQLDAWTEWTSLLFRAAELLSVCQHTDTSGTLPGDCQQDSAQFLAYKLGQLAAKFAARNVDLWHDYLFDLKSRDADCLLVESLLSDCDPQRDWQKAREAFVTGWQLTPCYSGIPAEEIGPHTDLYWAMRIGFSDKMLESTQAVVLSAEPAPTTAVVGDFQALMDTVCSMDRKLDEVLAGSSRELRERVMRHLIPVSDLIPLKVLNHLEKAERYYKSKVNDDLAKLSFAKAVEAALGHCFVSPLVDFMERHGWQQIDLAFPPPRGLQRKRAAALRKLKLWEWAELLDTLTPVSRGLSALGAKDLRRFMDQHVGARWPDFGPLAQCLRRVWELRGGSGHNEQAETRIETELLELKEIRELVLGLDNSPSVIAQIYRLLAPSRQS